MCRQTQGKGMCFVLLFIYMFFIQNTHSTLEYSQVHICGGLPLDWQQHDCVVLRSAFDASAV